VPAGSPLDVEAAERGNSCYFPGHVIPMLPEILSNGVCSLQEGVPRLCKSAFITYDQNAQPVGTKFANTIIRSSKRLRYIEAQAIIDATSGSHGRGHASAHTGHQAAHGDDAPSGESQPSSGPRHLLPLPGTRISYDPAAVVPHPDGDRRVADYPPAVIELLHNMNVLARRLQKRRHAQGQIVLDLPEVDLVLDEEGKVVDAVEEDESFTHTLIEMFMVEANEAVARLLDSVDVPYLRRVHPEPELKDAERLRQFVHVAGIRIPKLLDRKAIQSLLNHVRGKPEAHAINLAVLKSLTRAEYSPEPVGHYALASEAYCHFTSPIRRYADLTIHRLLAQYLEARDAAGGSGGRKRKKVHLEGAPTHDELVEIGRHISFTERRADDAERELRQVKLLELLGQKLGEEYLGVVTGITNFGIFVQIQPYLIEGLIRYEDLMDDWWDVDVAGGFIRGQRTGQRIGIGDVVKAIVVRTDAARRELDLAISKVLGKRKLLPPGQNGEGSTDQPPTQGPPHGPGKKPRKQNKENRKRHPPKHQAHPSQRGGGSRHQRPGGGGRGRRRG
jgi:ribonuclease R